MKNSPGTGLSNDDGDGNKNVNKVIGLGPVHTNTFSFENAYISKRWCLPGHTYTPSVLSRKKESLGNKANTFMNNRELKQRRRRQ